MQALGKLVIVYLTLLSAYAMASDPARTTREFRSQSTYDPVKLSTILTNDVTSESTRKFTRLMGGHIKLSTTPPTPSISPSSHEEDEAQWDDGLVLSSAGNGKENKKPHDDDDEKKTLAQQVKEGKYGLIQKEIYPQKIKRPGIISYLSNPEVPKDNAKNLGGLDEEEIWLAENHMLVLRGGNFPGQETEQPTGDLQGWTPIDNFQAPKRQVKIPTSPKVPPPFPIQLNEGGPVIILGSNDTDKPKWFDGLVPANETFLSDWNNTNEENVQNDKKTKPGTSLGGIIGPFFPSLPPGAVFLPPPSNQSDYDEDDQSIYYPPPYSFKYNQNNSTAVPPGPLVPGIILPPPPDFFSQLEEKKTTKSHITKYPKRPSTTPKSETHYNRKSNPKPHKFMSRSSTSSTKEPRPFTMKPLNKFKQKNITTSFTETTNPTEQVLPFVDVTTSSPNKVSTSEISEINTVRPIITNQVIETSTTEDHSDKPRWSGLNPKSPPIVAYYASSPSPIDDGVEITAKTIKPRKPQPSVPSSASYYFYEESNDDVSGTTPTPVYFQETTPSRVEEIYAREEEQTKKPYYVDISPSYQPRQQYSVEVIEPVIKTSSPRYQYTDPAPSTNLPVSSRIQSQRILSDSPNIFYKTVTERPQLNIHSFFTTPTPERFNHQPKSKPVYQYSFEAADYAQRGRQKDLYKPIQELQPQKQVTFNEWQDEIQHVGQQYNDYDTEIVPEQRLQPERSHYRTRAPSYPTTTVRSNVVDTTPNPGHAYYTKQDERLLDDVTREYFTNFGRKINKNKLVSTTPIYGKSSVTERPNYSTVNSFSTNSFDNRQKGYSTPRVKVHYGHSTQRPISLEGDTRVNYQRPLPTINPDAEFLPGYMPEEGNEWEQNRRNRAGKLIREYIPVDDYDPRIQAFSGPTRFGSMDDAREGRRVFPSRHISLIDDIAVNYGVPRPPINPDAEFIDTGNNGQGSRDKPSFYFASSLPGDGGHFYFLTPHAISQRQEHNSFAYSRPRGPRLGRQRQGPRDV